MIEMDNPFSSFSSSLEPAFDGLALRHFLAPCSALLIRDCGLDCEGGKEGGKGGREGEKREREEEEEEER
jgi:hypothetical protein